MLPIGRTTISPSRTTGRGAMRCTPRIADLGVVDERRHEEPGELPRARDGERRAAELLGRERARRAPSRRARRRRRAARRRERVSQPRTTGTTSPARSARRCRGRSGRGRRSRRLRAARSARGTPAATARVARSTRRQEQLQVDVEKSHSSTKVTAGTSRCARVRCSTICRRTPRSGSRRPSVADADAAPAAARRRLR